MHPRGKNRNKTADQDNETGQTTHTKYESKETYMDISELKKAEVGDRK